MDIFKAIQDLYKEKDRLDRLIQTLESGESRAKPRSMSSRRGRKGMSPEERSEVSRRMKAYWEKRKNGGESSEPPANA